MKKVAVIMSTYNGEKFIQEQVNSILSQKEVKVSLFIRDDSSFDNTFRILSDIQQDHDEISLFSGINVGVGNSFMQLLHAIPLSYDFYCFADQDDIWIEDKLIKAIEKIENCTGPVLYTSNQIICDSNGDKISMRYNHPPNASYLQILNSNPFAGCTMVWNKELQTILAQAHPTNNLLKNRIHDVWVAMTAACVGTITYDDNSYILYRQHENNVVGIKKVGYIKNCRDKLFNKVKQNGRSKLAKEILENYDGLIKSSDTKNTLRMYSEYSHSLKSKLEFLKSDIPFKNTCESKLGIIIKTLVNKI